MSKHILLFGAGKSATCLIDYLLADCSIFGWKLTVADSNLQMAQSKVGHAAFATALSIQVENDEQRATLIKQADVVISLLPPALHFLIAVDCLSFGKNLLTASYVDDNIKSLGTDVKSKGLLFLCEMGLDPGIDHMSAMYLLDSLRNEGANVTTFRSHCGGLIAPESDDNPWHYKVSWNPGNIIQAGSSGAAYKEDGVVYQKNYHELFDCTTVNIDGLGTLAYYPNRDSLAYMPLYGLENAQTFMRTTLRYPAFCRAWKSIVLAGLSSNVKNAALKTFKYKDWSKSILPFLTDDTRELLSYLGLFDDLPVPSEATSSSDILQYLLETRLAMRDDDKDMIVMLHQIGYELEGKLYTRESTLIVTGEDSVRTAMSKTVGLPLGIATSLILRSKINLKGIHIPTLPEIYVPVLKQLHHHGIVFNDSQSR